VHGTILSARCQSASNVPDVYDDDDDDDDDDDAEYDCPCRS